MRCTLSSSRLIVTRFQQAINQRDLDSLFGCLHPLYQEEKPLFPGNGLLDREETRQQWQALFTIVPDLRADDERWIIHDETVCTHWHWYGRSTIGKRFELAGTTLFGIEANAILWGRFSLFPVRRFRLKSCTTLEDLAAWRWLSDDLRRRRCCF